MLKLAFRYVLSDFKFLRFILTKSWYLSNLKSFLFTFNCIVKLVFGKFFIRIIIWPVRQKFLICVILKFNRLLMASNYFQLYLKKFLKLLIYKIVFWFVAVLLHTNFTFRYILFFQSINIKIGIWNFIYLSTFGTLFLNFNYNSC